MTRSGLARSSSCGPSPQRSRVPGLKFSSRTSDRRTRSSTMRLPSSVLRSSTTDFLLRLIVRYSIDVSPPYSRQLRSSSPVAGLSTLITSAPKSASIGLPSARRCSCRVRALGCRPVVGSRRSLRDSSFFQGSTTVRTPVTAAGSTGSPPPSDRHSYRAGLSVPRVLWPISDCRSQNVLLVTCTRNSDPARRPGRSARGPVR